MSDKTELQRAILITAYNYPDATQAEIADACDCSSSYVSQVLREYDSQDAMEARIEEMNQALGFDQSAGFGAGWENDIGMRGVDFEPEPLDIPEDQQVDLAEVINDGIQGLKVLSKKIRSLIRKIRS